MPKLLDEVITNKNWMPWTFGDPSGVPMEAMRAYYLPKLKKATAILADDVAHYYYVTNDEEYWDLRVDFPNLAPPFELCWIEWGPIRHINSNKYGENSVAEASGLAEFVGPNLGVASGVLIEAVKSEQGWKLLASEWSLLTCQRNVVNAPPFRMHFEVDHQGHYIGDKPASLEVLCTQGNSVANSIIPRMGSMMHPAFLTFSFLHCKNVTLNRKENSPKLAKRYKERHGIDMITYSTINIEPMKKVLRSEGESDSKGLKVAMHICRGHFATYGGDSGKGKLFGKYEGTYWIPMHVKGSQERGEVHPTYKVKL